MTPRHRSLLFALIAFNLVVKLLWLGTNELAHDEPFTVYWSQQPLGAFWEMLRTENNPPLYFLLIKAWSAFTPFEAAWLRVPSAIFSSLAVWPLFLLGLHLGGRRTALIASLLYTLNNYHYGFAHEVRVYSLFTLLATTGMWLLWRAGYKHDSRLRAMLGLAAINVLMVYSHFFGWLAIGVQVLIVTILPGTRTMRRPFFIGLAITLVCFSPYLFIFAQRASSSISEGTWLGPPVPEELYNMIWRWSNAPLLAVGFLLIVVGGILRLPPLYVGLRLAIIWCFIPLLGMFAVSFAVPMFLDRYMVYAAPGFALLVALSLMALGLPRWATGSLIAIVTVGMAITFAPWQEGLYHPSRVVAQANAWCPQGCTEHIWPPWYRLTFRAAIDINTLKEDHGPMLAADINHAQVLVRDSIRPTLVICAGGDAQGFEQNWYRQLRQAYSIVDSVEADHRVWVYRFRQ